MAEGAGALVLESLAHARARGATVLGVVEGCGEMADGFHRTRSIPDGKPIIACMRHALDDAGAGAGPIGYINAHGTGTPENDKMEWLGVSAVFGERAALDPDLVEQVDDRPHVDRRRRGRGGVHAARRCGTAGCRRPSTTRCPTRRCRSIACPNVARDAQVARAISNSFGFGGQNVCLVLGAAPWLMPRADSGRVAARPGRSAGGAASAPPSCACWPRRARLSPIHTARSRRDHGGGHTARQLDLADRDAVETFARELEDAPPVDTLVQVGGTTYDMLAAMMEQDAAERAMQVNFWSFARIARAVVRPMIRARRGRIVAIGSVIGLQASQGNAAYAASKAALLGYVRTLAIETARRGVTVNYVAPGFVDTDMLAPFAAYRVATEARIPCGRYASPEEIAAVVGFLRLPCRRLRHRAR